MKKTPAKQSGIREATLLCAKTFFTFMLLLMAFESCKKADFTVQQSQAVNGQDAIIKGSYDLQLVADKFVSPLGVVDPNDGTKRLFCDRPDRKSMDHLQ